MVQLSAIPIAAKGIINDACKGCEPWQIVAMTSTTILATMWMWTFLDHDENLVKRAKRAAWRFARLTFLRGKIDKVIEELDDEFQHEAVNRAKYIPFVTSLPRNGLQTLEIMKKVEEYIGLGDYDWKNGRVSGCVYRGADEGLMDLMSKVYGMASYTNPLHPDVFPGVCKMEAEVVRIACRLFGGGETACGTMSTGGTESILLACKAYRDYGKEVKGITRPEMVIPVTAHCAFDKAAQYLNIRVRSIPVDPVSFAVDVDAMKKAITGNTIMLVGSTPNFPYGTMDDIEAVSALGVRYDIPVHVDACLGGFLICFMKEIDCDLPPFDFRVPGVCSISADTHKYGYAPKGSSVILYRDKKYREKQYTVTTDWPGGMYGSPTINGSRSGGIIAACWATFMYFGLDGYVQSTRAIIDTSRHIEFKLRNIDGIFVFGKPATSVIAVGSNDFEIYRLADKLGARGWNLNLLQFPSAFHICITYVHTAPGVAEQFVKDVTEDVANILREPDAPAVGKFAFYGASQTILDRSVINDFIFKYLDSTYYTPPSSNAAIAADDVDHPHGT